METFDSIDEVERAYRELIERQETLQDELFGSDETDWDRVQGQVQAQNEIMQKIEQSETVDERFQTERSDTFRSLIEKYAGQHERLTQEIDERRSELEKQLESLDQSMDLLDEYGQSSGSSYHVDEKI